MENSNMDAPISITLEPSVSPTSQIVCFVCNIQYSEYLDISFYQINKMDNCTGLVPLELLKNSVQELEIEVDDSDQICSKCFILLRQFYQFYKEILRITNYVRVQLYQKYSVSEINEEDYNDGQRMILCGKCEYTTPIKSLLKHHQKFHQEIGLRDEYSDEESLDEIDKLDSDQCYVLSQVGRLEKLRMQLEEEVIDAEISMENDDENDIFDEEFKTSINGAIYTCNRCQYEAEGWKDYYTHMDKIHKGFNSTDPNLEMDGTLKCSYCREELPNSKEKLKHLRAHKQAIRKKKIRAFYRAIRVKNPTYKPFTAVEKEVYGIRQTFDCVNCPVKFQKQIDIINHSRSAHSLTVAQMKLFYETKYDMTCNECKEIFLTYNAKLQHAREHRDLLEIESGFTDTRSDLPPNNKSLKIRPPKAQVLVNLNPIKHPRPNIESQYRMVKCDICSKQLIAQSLDYHRASHVQQATVPCRYCDKMFKGVQQLKAHERRNHRTQNCICEKCGVAFKTPGELSQHRKWHDNPYPHECEICGKRYRYRNTLPIHMRTAHTKEKTHACKECGDRFYSSAKLIRHMRVHTGGFICPHCQKEYYTKYALSDHMIKNHGDETLKQSLRKFKRTSDIIQDFKEK